MAIERVPKAAIVEKEVLEGNSAGRNAFTVGAFGEALILNLGRVLKMHGRIRAQLSIRRSTTIIH